MLVVLILVTIHVMRIMLIIPIIPAILVRLILLMILVTLMMRVPLMTLLKPSVIMTGIFISLSRRGGWVIFVDVDEEGELGGGWRGR